MQESDDAAIEMTHVRTLALSRGFRSKECVETDQAKNQVPTDSFPCCMSESASPPTEEQYYEV
jgi:hypothetical protein